MSNDKRPTPQEFGELAKELAALELAYDAACHTYDEAGRARNTARTRLDLAREQFRKVADLFAPPPPKPVAVAARERRPFTGDHG